MCFQLLDVSVIQIDHDVSKVMMVIEQILIFSCQENAMYACIQNEICGPKRLNFCSLTLAVLLV